MIPVNLLCPYCIEPISDSSHFCPKCGAPITSFAVTDPLLSVRAEGEMVRRAMHCPSLLVVIGTWVLFGLPALCCLAIFVLAVFALIIEGFPGFQELGTFLIGLPAAGFFLFLYFAIVRKVTQSYWAARKTPCEPETLACDNEE